MDSLGSHFEFLPLHSLHIGSDDWNRPVRGCMVVAKAGSSTVITSKTATEIKNMGEIERDRTWKTNTVTRRRKKLT
jgi:hypothetical protein